MAAVRIRRPCSASRTPRLLPAAIARAVPVLALLAAALLAGCGRKGGGGKLVFAVGGVPAELAAWERIARDFTAATGVPVDLLRQPADSDQRRQGLAVALQAGRPEPDVFLMDVAWVAQFASSGWLSPLDAAGDSLPPSAAFPAAAAQAGTWQGKRMSLPVYVDGGLLYYRKDLLEKYGYQAPPSTWGDLRNMAAKVEAGERARDPAFFGYVWQGAQYEGLVCDFLEAAASGGGGLPVRNGSLGADSEPNRRALAMLRGLIENGLSPPETYAGMKEEEARLYFQKGSALFERNWPYAWALHEAEGSPVRGKTGAAPLPHFEGGEPAAALGGWQIGISRFSRRRAEAEKLARYVVSLPVQKRLALELGWNPGRSEAYADSALLAAHPHYAVLGEALSHAVARPGLPYWTLLSEILQRHLNAALAGKEAPAAALQAAQAEIDAAAARYGRP